MKFLPSLLLALIGVSSGMDPVQASTLRCDADGIPISCRVFGRGSFTDDRGLCRSHSVARERCYVDVQYPNGRRQRLIGNECVNFPSDCLDNARYALHPPCTEVIELP